MPTLVLDLDLDAPPRDQIPLGNHDRIRAIVWRGDQPLGQIVVEGSGEIAGERLLAEARRRCGDAPPPPAEDASQLPMVSVAICTRGRPDELEECLNALDAQRDAPHHEILVVDNAPLDDRTRDVVARFQDARYVIEAKPGGGFARNRALWEASGEILAFVDDDTRPATGWLRSVATVFHRDPSVGVCGGPTVPLELETEAQELFERRGGFPQRFERRVYGPGTPGGWDARHWPLLAGSLVSGCNLALRIEPLRELGGFDEALGPGTPSRGGEDHDVVCRMLVAGHRMAVEPSALTRHRHRRDVDGLKRQLHGWGCGTVAFLTKSGRGGRRDRYAALQVTVWLLAHQLRLLLATLRPGSRRRFPSSLAAVELAGSLHGLWAYRRSQRYVRRVRGSSSARG